MAVIATQPRLSRTRAKTLTRWSSAGPFPTSRKDGVKVGGRKQDRVNSLSPLVPCNIEEVKNYIQRWSKQRQISISCWTFTRKAHQFHQFHTPAHAGLTKLSNNRLKPRRRNPWVKHRLAVVYSSHQGDLELWLICIAVNDSRRSTGVTGVGETCSGKSSWKTVLSPNGKPQVYGQYRLTTV